MKTCIVSFIRHTVNKLSALCMVALSTLVLHVPIGYVSTARAQTENLQWNVAIFIFDKVQIIDYTGPYEVFVNAASNNHPRFNVYTVATKSAAITTVGGMSVNPSYDFENHPRPDILVLPGGWGVYATRKNPEVIKWIQENAQKAEVVLSVCNGAFFLSKAGLLGGLQATTTAGAIPRLQIEVPTCKVVSNKRFVDNGKIITSAGLSAGIDASLHVVSRILSKGWARRVAIDMEYNWQPESTFARAELADMYLPPPYTHPSGYREPISYEGGTDHWETKTIIETDSSAAEVLKSINSLIVKYEKFLKWARIDNENSRGTTESHWKFTRQEGNMWHGIIRAEPVAGQANKVILTMKIALRDEKFPGNY